MYPNGAIKLPDDGSIDAFGRLRVSEPSLLLDVKRVGNTPDNTATTSASGTGAVAYQINRSSTYLTVGPAVGTAIRQSKTRAIYQPGKSLLTMMTFVMAPAQVGLRQRVGYFDAKNGIFLEMNGNTLSFVRRSYVSGSAVDEAIPQSSWFIDQMTGVGISHKTLDITKPQILVIDMEWLGVGRVRVGFVIDGLIHYVHDFRNANSTITSVYITNPNLPVRWEAEATAGITGTATLESICASVGSEGGYQVNGTNASADTDGVSNSVASGANEEILAVRMQAAFTEFSTVFIQSLSAICTTNGSFRWRLVLNPTETSAGTWSAVTSSILEQNSTRVVTHNTGLVLAVGYVSANSGSITIEANPVLRAGTSLAGVTDVYSLQIFNLMGGADTFYGSMSWRELY